MITNSFLLGSLGVIKGPVLATVIFAIAGFLGGFIQVNIFSILQVTTPSEIRGRVFGFISTVSGSIAPLGMGIGGIIGDVTGLPIPTLYLITGGILVIISATVALNSAAREFLAFDVREAKEVELKMGQDVIPGP